MEANVPTLTLSASLTSLFKLQTRRTCQQWPQGNDKTVLCCLLAGENKTNKKKPRKGHAISPLVSLAMPQLHCERPCVSVQGLLTLCLATTSRWGGGTRGCGLLLANHSHVMRRAHCTCCCCCCFGCALARWPCERPRPDSERGRNGSYFLQSFHR